ncbi:MAG: hypothetical protein IIB77_07625 [Proteobacteria bacterium]|nr:hypothetical protein [Pseudomonadota bacterium]
MNNTETTHIGDTLRIRRPPRVITDELGRTAWMGAVESCDLELDSRVSTDPYNSTVALGRHTNMRR